MTRTQRSIGLLTAALTVLPLVARAEDAGVGRRIWYGVAAVGMNVLPVVSAFASQKCLPGYVACKLSFAGMGLVASGTQLLVGGDVDGARRTAERAVGGDWVVLPRHVAEGVKPDPYPEPEAGAVDPTLPSF